MPFLSFFEIQFKERYEKVWQTYYFEGGAATGYMFPSKKAAMRWLEENEDGRNLFDDFDVQIFGFKPSRTGARLRCRAKVMLTYDPLLDKKTVLPCAFSVRG
jgi:hypothetical protein